MIHPTALIHPNAQVDPTVSIGAYCIIEEKVSVGPRCRLGPMVHLKGETVIGADNKFFTGAVVGEDPQDLKFKFGQPSRLRVGDNNTFRENVTVHRGNNLEEDTVIGSNNLFMAGCHVAHNCQLGSHLVIANGALFGGHVHVADRALISGNCLIHQFVRVGTLAIMQGGSAISKDLPPFTVARGPNGICGLNIIGLRRAGFSSEQRLELRRLYHLLFRSGQKMGSALAAARDEFTSETARLLIDFIASSKRGVCRDTGSLVSEAQEVE